jgi:hypothetical protein
MVFMQVLGRFANIGERCFGDITNYQRRDIAQFQGGTGP